LIIKLQNNVPAVLKLLDRGERADGHYGPQVRFNVEAEDGYKGLIYLNTKDDGDKGLDVAGKLLERIQVGEWFVIEKSTTGPGGGKKTATITWKIEAVEKKQEQRVQNSAPASLPVAISQAPAPTIVPDQDAAALILGRSYAIFLKAAKIALEESGLPYRTDDARAVAAVMSSTAIEAAKLAAGRVQ
jgi:hypothetical protein